MIRITNKLLLGFVLAVLIVAASGLAYAVPSASISYQETDLGTGWYRYEYSVSNTSDPVLDSGFDLYDFTIYFDSGLAASVYALPAGWESIGGDQGFLEMYSANPGVAPDGNDIGPGAYLGGFTIDLNYQAGALMFDVTMANPNDTENPALYSGQTMAGVPLPASLLLLGPGIGVLMVNKKFLITKKSCG